MDTADIANAPIRALPSHEKVDLTLNVYTQVRDESVRAAVAPVGEELFRIVQSSEGASALIH